MTVSVKKKLATTRHKNGELRTALIITLLIGGGYIVYELTATPNPAGTVGHLMGIVGILLMMFTELGYMLRKRVHWFKVGRLSKWLSLHIITGIVGPALVILHSTFEFRGMALISSVLTVIVVASGFLGRYFYTAIPRTIAGFEVEHNELEAQIVQARTQYDNAVALRSEKVRRIITQTLPLRPVKEMSSWNVLTRAWDNWRYQRRVEKAVSQLELNERESARQLAQLQNQLRQAERQLAMLASTHRLMGYWHLVHLPMGITLFGSAFIHVIAVFYYGGVPVQ